MGLFRKKSEKEKLTKRYQALVKEAHKLSHTDRKASDIKQAEAETLWKTIEQMD